MFNDDKIGPQCSAQSLVLSSLSFVVRLDRNFSAQSLRGFQRWQHWTAVFWAIFGFDILEYDEKFGPHNAARTFGLWLPQILWNDEI